MTDLSTPLFVSGIGTEVGKTVVAAALVEALGTTYWKPVQSGDLDNTDTMKVRRWVSNPAAEFLPERYRLTRPASPHWSAAEDGVELKKADFELPKSRRPLLIEGAGGLLVPLSLELLWPELIAWWKAEVVLVVRHYLGSINHTLLSLDYLKRHKLKLRGIIWNGPPHPTSEQAIRSFFPEVTELFRLNEAAGEIDAAFIESEGQRLRSQSVFG